MGVTNGDSDTHPVWVDLQRVIRNQLRPYSLHHGGLLSSYEPHKRRLVELIKRTVSTGESNSVLIIGPRGSGKSAVLSSAVSTLYEDAAVRDNLIHIQLNGLVHTDDNIALKDIMAQLQVRGEGDEISASFAEKMALLLDALKSGSKRNKSILFVLDEFDLFCMHKEQTLLYNLFDVAQSQQSPICVVGLSCRPDILSKLENRVRSRFSHQQVLLFQQLQFEDYISVAKLALSLPRDFADARFSTQWNKSVEEVVELQSVKDILRARFNYNCNLRELKKFLLYPIMFLDPTEPSLKPGHFLDAFASLSRDTKIVMIHGLSVLEISLVIAMMHLTELYDGEPFNFELVYHEYKKFLQKKMSVKSLDKAVVLKALEHLIGIDLVQEIGDSGGNKLKRFVPLRLLLEPSQIRDALCRYQNLPSQLQQWALSPVVD